MTKRRKVQPNKKNKNVCILQKQTLHKRIIMHQCHISLFYRIRYVKFHSPFGAGSRTEFLLVKENFSQPSDFSGDWQISLS